MAEGPAGSVLVVIPTYNERDNLEPLLARMHAVVPDAPAVEAPVPVVEVPPELVAEDLRVFFG